MMRRLLLPCFLFCACLCRANGIDSLHSKTDVVNFLTKYVNQYCIDWHIYTGKYDVLRDKERGYHRTNSFYKADVDGNGLTDLIVDGWYAGVILDKGDRYEEHRVDNTLFFSRYIFKDLVEVPGKPLMLIYEDRASYRPHEKTGIDTFVFGFGDLVEYNAHRQDQHIKNVKFSAMGCYGLCPVCDIEISADGSMWLNAEMYNKQDGNFYGQLSKDELEEWRALNEYVNYEAIKGTSYNSYENKDRSSTVVTDGAEAQLTITYANGAVKTIASEDAMNICMGARAVYDFLKKVMAENIWKDWKDVPERYVLRNGVSFHNYRDGADRTTYILSAHSARDMKVYTSGHSVFAFSPDHTFVYTYSKTYPEGKNKFAIGRWKQLNDTTMIVNWNGALTLKKVRDGSYKKYIDVDEVMPMRIDKWMFKVLDDGKVLYVRRF